MARSVQGYPQKIEDFYLNLRERISRWAKEGQLARTTGKWTDQLTQYLLVLPDIVHLKIRLLLDNGIPSAIKSYILLGLVYLISPIDFLPDIIPVVGFVDDLLVLVVLLNKIINTKNPLVIERIKIYWAGDTDVFAKVKEIVAIINELSSRIPQAITHFIKKKS